MSRQFKYIQFLLKYPVYKFFKQRDKYISNPNFLIIASIFVAIVVSLAAIFLKWFIHLIESWIINTSLLELSIANVIFPAIGIVLSLILAKNILRVGSFEKGLAGVIYCVNYRKGKIEKFHSYIHLLTSAITVSLGGSVGVEAPIAVTGSAIGSNLASRFFLKDSDRNLLLACGASAGISAIFNCPVGGVVFALEVILGKVTISAFVPLLIASATAAVISNIFYGGGQLISFAAQPWEMKAIPFYVMLAALCGMFSVYSIRSIDWVETHFANSRQSILRAAVQGLFVGLMILFSPLLYGEGYFVINQILHNKFDTYMQSIALQSNFGYTIVFLSFVITTLFLKPIAAALTVSSGGNGGVFAPSLFMGALLGLLFSRLVNLTEFQDLNELNFVVAGMAGILSGVMSAPMTGIFMIAEIAGGYQLFVPLMIVSAGSYFVTRLFEPNSIYTRKLARAGLLDPPGEMPALKELTVRAVLETDFPDFQPDDSLRKVTEVISTTRRNVFPVVNRNHELVGIMSMGDIRQVLFKPAVYDRTKVSDLMQDSVVSIDLEASLGELNEILEENPAIFYIPVVSGRKYAGMVSKSTFLNKYKLLMSEWVQTHVN